ncbi:MAG: hypothetical protein IPJ76_06390 [Flavobacteriales bacterium]|nr:MAG: hypothetical protein IPJ76_06390 [Flavobacteriales bacterium]
MNEQVLQKVCLLLGFYAIGCSPGPEDPMVVEPLGRDTSNVVSQKDTIRYDPIGTWVLTEFHDSIAVHRRIGRYRMPIPAWTALVLRVDSDTVRCNGILLPWVRKFNRAGRDTILEIDDYGPQTFIHDPVADTVRVIWMNPGVPGQSGILHYRRLRLDELHLLKGIDVIHPAPEDRFRSNYRAYLTRLLFEGHYDPLDDGQHGFRIDEQGRISGHPIWNEFYFHDYFGTRHPWRDELDGLVFRDTTERWPAGTFGFSWRFATDTLVLHRMTTDGDFYYPAKGAMRFLKLRERN